MKTRLLLLLFCLAAGLTAQQTHIAPQDLALEYLHSKAEQWQLAPEDVRDMRLTAQTYSKHNGVTHLYFVQQLSGVDIQQATYQVHIKDEKIVHATQQLVPISQAGISPAQPAIPAETAVKAAHDELGFPVRTALQRKSSDATGKIRFDNGAVSHLDITAGLSYVQSRNGEYVLAWDVFTEPVGDLNMWSVHVHAATGKIISKRSLTLHCSFPDNYLERAHDCTEHAEMTTAWPLSNGGEALYNIIPVPLESPRHGERVLTPDPSDQEASLYGWHDLDGVEGPDTTITMGNNVHAFVDRDGDFEPDTVVADGGDSLLFDFPFDQQLEPVDYQEAATTNLFYMNNIMHDFTYFYGFDELNGNFQHVNYTGTGAGEDAVQAHSQFNSGTADPSLNNATFGTPADGGSGRMRMFVFQGSANELLRVDSPSVIAGPIATGTTNDQWGALITDDAVTGEVAIVQDATGTPMQGCNELTNPEDIEGKIALIDRGTCEFGLKALNAQEAGAIGFIICNFQEGVINMAPGEVGTQVTIPGVFISNSDCQRIRVWAGNGLTVSLVDETAGTGPTRRSASFDNGIIAHEYGHGISNRLTGGPQSSGCLRNFDHDNDGSSEDGEQMGEGWSDFFTLVTSVRPGDVGETARGIGTYSLGQETNGQGFRPFTYSTNMSVNPMTYDDIAFNSVPHGIGTVWCSMLWDMYWAFVDRYGYDPDLYRGTGGNNMAIQLVMDGFKLQPCNPGFVDGRDAILKADSILYDAANSDIIWEVFARRGLGYSADQGEDEFRLDGTEAFDIHPLVTRELKIYKQVTPNIDPGDQIDVTLTAINHKTEDVSGVIVSDVIPEGTTYADGSADMAFNLVGDVISFTLEEMAAGDTAVINYQLQSSSKLASEQVFFDDMENGNFNWDLIIDEPLDQVIWSLQQFITYDGTSWGCENLDTTSDQSLVTLDEITVTGENPMLAFYNYYDTEKFFDAGIIQVSTDNGLTWSTIPEERLTRGGYSAKIQYGLFAIPNIKAWHGKSNDWEQVLIDLSDYTGESVKIRFRFGSDTNTANVGWFMDNFELMDALTYNSEVCITSDQGDNACTVAPEEGTLVSSNAVSTTKDDIKDGLALSVYPNPVREQLTIDVSTIAADQVRLSLTSSTGQLVWSSEADVHRNLRVEVDTKMFPDGIYFVTVEGESGRLIKKLILQ